MSKIANQFRFSWIDENIAGFAFPHSEEQIKFLSKQGINIIISLSREPLNKKIAKKYGLEVVHLPIIDFSIPNDSILKRFIEIVDDSIKQDKKIGVHCKYGIGRTGLMLAIYLIEFKNMSPEQALRKIRELRPGSVESFEQINYLLKYKKTHS